MSEGGLVELCYLLLAKDQHPRGCNRLLALCFWFANFIDRIRGTAFQCPTTTLSLTSPKNLQELLRVKLAPPSLSPNENERNDIDRLKAELENIQCPPNILTPSLPAR